MLGVDIMFPLLLFYFLDSICHTHDIWASSRANLPSGFPNRPCSIHSAQLQRLARIVVRHPTLQEVNNIGADQSARMRKLVCACVIRMQQSRSTNKTSVSISLSVDDAVLLCLGFM